ncbi:MAG: trypsin-like peptidase domain-containing protein, partial [Verrucomicrobiota bacterium]
MGGPGVVVATWGIMWGCWTSWVHAVPAPAYDPIEAASVEVFGERRLLGSGWVVANEGLAFTAAHVVQGKANIELRLADGQRCPAEVLAWDRGHDLALLRSSSLPKDQPGLQLAAAVPEPGHPAFLFGSPIFRHGIMVTGYVSKPEPSYEWNPDLRTIVEIHYLSAPSPVGMSGGVWVNEKGMVVGLQSGMMVHQGAPVGIAFACGVEPMRSLLEKRTSRSDPFLGAVVEEMGEQKPSVLETIPADTRGVVVRILVEGSPMQSILQVGDVVQSVNGAGI